MQRKRRRLIVLRTDEVHLATTQCECRSTQIVALRVVTIVAAKLVSARIGAWVPVDTLATVASYSRRRLESARAAKPPTVKL